MKTLVLFVVVFNTALIVAMFATIAYVLALASGGVGILAQ